MGWSNGFGLLSNDPGRPLHYRFLKRQRHRVNDWIAHSSLIPNDPVLDPGAFDWTRPLRAEWQAIRAEAMAVYQHLSAIPPLREISPDHRGIVKDNSWRSFFLIGYGHRQEANMARAPRTADLVSRIPGLNSAFFSILGPGTQITPHRGVTKAFITAHLGLKVPRDGPSCWMRVDDQRLHWREGEWTAFDDTYEHEVRNETDETRIILLCQVERPLRQPGRFFADALMAYVQRSHFIREAKQNLASWDRAYAALERE